MPHAVCVPPNLHAMRALGFGPVKKCVRVCESVFVRVRVSECVFTRSGPVGRRVSGPVKKCVCVCVCVCERVCL